MGTSLKLTTTTNVLHIEVAGRGVGGVEFVEVNHVAGPDGDQIVGGDVLGEEARHAALVVGRQVVRDVGSGGEGPDGGGGREGVPGAIPGSAQLLGAGGEIDAGAGVDDLAVEDVGGLDLVVPAEEEGVPGAAADLGLQGQFGVSGADLEAGAYRADLHEGAHFGGDGIVGGVDVHDFGDLEGISDLPIEEGLHALADHVLADVEATGRPVGVCGIGLDGEGGQGERGGEEDCGFHCFLGGWLIAVNAKMKP